MRSVRVSILVLLLASTLAGVAHGEESSPLRETSPPVSHTKATIGLITAGVGAALITTSVFLGLSAKSKWDDSNDLGRCVDDICSPEGLAIRDSARSRGTTATIVFSIGAAVLVTGSVLYLTSPLGEAAAKGPSSVRIGIGPGSLSLAGRF